MTPALRILSLSAALGLCLAVGERPASEARAKGESRPWSAQLHVHGPFSEGLGSIDSHSYEAADVGVDVIWWSDHDFRIASWRHVSTFGFDAWKVPLDRGEPWTAWSERERTATKGLRLRKLRSMRGGQAWVDGKGPARGRACLRLEGAHSDPEPAEHVFVLGADRALTQRPLAADVRLELMVEMLAGGPDAGAFVEVKLSEHAPRDGLDFKPYGLRYVFTNERAEPWYEDETYCIPLAWQPGGWVRRELHLTRDAARGFEGSPGEDNTLQQVSFGIHSRNGARAAVRFDDLRIQQRRRGMQTFRRQAELIGEVSRLYPGITQHQGLELSAMANHLNEYSLDTRLLDLDAAVRDSGLLRGDPPTIDQDAFEAYLTESVVPAIQARGGLVSYNHMFGNRLPGEEPKTDRETVLADMLRTRAAGVDLLEVGYRDRGGRPLEDHLWVWDHLAEGGLFLIGVGVSDSHGGPDGRWRTSVNNFVSWIWAPTTGKADLLEGLRAGRVYFGDPVLFDGRLDVVTDGGFRMGQVVVTDRERVAAALESAGELGPDRRVHAVVDGERAATWTPGDGRQLRHELVLPPGARRSVRFEVYAADGTAVVFTNPIWFVREFPADPLPPVRLGLDLGGTRVRGLAGFELSEVRIVEEGGAAALRLVGRAAGGELTASREDGRTVRVRLDGLAGRAGEPGSATRVTELYGEGSLLLY